MASTSRNISWACGKANNKSWWNSSGCIIKGQHVELKSITSRNSVGSWYVAITSRNSNIKESRCVASPPAYKKKSKIYSIDQLLRASGSYRISPTNCRCRHVICFIIKKMPVQDIADQMACMSRFNEDLISLVSEAPVVATTAVVLWPVFSDKKMY